MLAVTLVDAGKKPLSTMWNLDFEFLGTSMLSVAGMEFVECGVIRNQFDTSSRKSTPLVNIHQMPTIVVCATANMALPRS